MTDQVQSQETETKDEKPLFPKGECHCCGWKKIPKNALWCSTDCATEYHSVRTKFLGP